MSVLVYTESDKGKFKKNAFEVASYAYAVAQQIGETVTAVSINAKLSGLQPSMAGQCQELLITSGISLKVAGSPSGSIAH